MNTNVIAACMIDCPSNDVMEMRDPIIDFNEYYEY